MKNWQVHLLIGHAWLIAGLFAPTSLHRAAAVVIAIVFLVWTGLSGYGDGK